MTSDETPAQVQYDQDLSPPAGDPTSRQPENSPVADSLQSKGGRARAANAARDGRGKYRTKAEDVARDAECAKLYDKGWTYQRIADHFGMAGHQRASDAIKRHLKRIPQHDLSERRAQQQERIQDLRERVTKIADARHVAYSTGSGRVVEIEVEDPDNPGTFKVEPVTDYGPTLKAIQELRALLEREAKLYGLDAPSKQEFSGSLEVGVQLVGVDPDDI